MFKKLLLGLTLLLSSFIPAVGMNSYTIPSGAAITSVTPVVGTPGTCAATSGWISYPNVGACVHVASGTQTLTSHFTTSVNGTTGAMVMYVSDTQWGAKILSTGDPVWDSEGAATIIAGFDVSGNGGTTTPCHNILLDGNNSIVVGNKVHDMPGGGCSFGGAGIQIGQANGAGAGSQIIRNLLDNIASSFSGPNTFVHGIYASSSNVTVESNIISRAHGYCIQYNHDTAGNVIANNTIMNCYFGGIGMTGTSGTPFDHSSIFNNLDIFTAGAIGSGTDCAIENRFGSSGNNNAYRGNFLAHYSCPFFFEQGSEFLSGNLCDVTGTGCPTPNLTVSQATATNIFVNYTGNAITGDYHLKSGSAAIGVGATGTCAPGGLNPCVPLLDFYGNSFTAPYPAGAVASGVSGIPNPPTNVTVTVSSFSGFDQLPSAWIATNTFGNPTATSQSFGASPAIDSSSMLLSVTGPANSGALWLANIANNDITTSMSYDTYTLLNSNTSVLGYIEFGMTLHSSSGGREYNWATRCNFVTGFWEVFGNGVWNTTATVCSMSPSIWHHIQISAHRVSGDTSCAGVDCVYYDSLIFDGVSSTINQKYPAASWAGAGSVQFDTQLDIGTSGSGGLPVTVNYDKMFVTYK